MLKQVKSLYRLPFYLICTLIFTTFFSTLLIGYRPVAVHAATTYVHPGMLHTQSDLDRMKTKVAAGTSPWIDEWRLLQDNSLALSSYTTTYYSTVYRNDPTNGNVGSDSLSQSASAAYLNALEWYITGNQAYANTAKNILNGWSNTLTAIQGNSYDIDILAGMTGYKLLNAAEILRYTNAGWQQTDIDNFSSMMTNVFYNPITKNFASLNGMGAVDSLNILFNICYGVWNNDDVAFNAAVSYFKSGSGNGSIDHFIATADGQTQEAGRDQPHNQLALGLLADAAEVGYNQQTVNSNGADMVSYPNNTYGLLKGVEYTAKYNLGYPVPFVRVPFVDGTAPYSSVSSGSRGQFRPIYEQIYNLYHNKVGLPDTAMPFTKLAVDSVKLELFSSDHPSYGGLLNAQDTRTSPLIPTIAFSSYNNTTSVVSAPNGGTSPLVDNVNRFNSDGSLNVGSQETFTMEYQGNKTYSFKSLANNKYVSANGTTSLVADSATVGTAQKYTGINNSNMLFNFQSQANNMYVVADSTSKQLAASSSSRSGDDRAYIIFHQRAAVTSTDTPTTPTNLTASVINNGQIKLNWTTSTDNNGVIGYQIFRNGVQVGTAYTNSYIDTGLAASTTYSYTVKAYDAANVVSAQSNTVSNTTAGTNLALSKSVTVSSTLNNVNWNQAYINDGQIPATSSNYGWSTNNSLSVNHTEWAQIDLGAANTISQVTLFPRNDGINAGFGFPIDFNIQVSTDGTNWTTVVTKTNYPFVNGGQAFTFTPVSARYVKVTGTSLRLNPNDASLYRMQLAELEIYQQITSGATYKLVARHSGKLAGVDTSTGNVIQQTDTASNLQQWTITDLSNGYYKIINANSGKALDVSGANTVNGAPIIQWPYNGSNNQQWQIVDVGSGYYKIISRNSGKVMDVSGANTADGTQIQQYTYNGYNNQMWSLVKQ